MKASAKIDLISQIGRELQSRYSYDEIDIFLREYGVAPPEDVSVNSKWVYTKQALSNIDTKTILRIANDLSLNTFNPTINSYSPPEIWQDRKEFRLFISHSAKYKKRATRVKEELSTYNISSFVAHEDIEPDLQWQTEIERALHVMDAMLTIHTAGFCESCWTQQEIGFALGRGIKVISFKMDEAPTGFINKTQAIPWNKRTADQIAQEIVSLLEKDPLTSSKMEDVKLLNQQIELDEEIPF